MLQTNVLGKDAEPNRLRRLRGKQPKAAAQRMSAWMRNTLDRGIVKFDALPNADWTRLD
jgi:hypothetical protein